MDIVDAGLEIEIDGETYALPAPPGGGEIVSVFRYAGDVVVRRKRASSLLDQNAVVSYIFRGDGVGWDWEALTYQ